MTATPREIPTGRDWFGNQSIRFKLNTIVLVYITIILALLAIAVFSSGLNNSVRAYTQGESLWSKAQKDSVYYLMRYARLRDEQDYRKYLREMRFLWRPHARLKQNKPQSRETRLVVEQALRRLPFFRSASSLWCSRGRGERPHGCTPVGRRNRPIARLKDLHVNEFLVEAQLQTAMWCMCRVSATCPRSCGRAHRMGGGIHPVAVAGASAPWRQRGGLCGF